MPIISNALFNIIMNDRVIEERLPKLLFLRFIYEIIIPISHKEKKNGRVLLSCFGRYMECHLLSPSFEHAVRGGKPLSFLGGLIKMKINNDGKCEMESVS